jgi:hypothetical protein
MRDLLEILNGHGHRARLARHWAEGLVLDVSDFLLELDPAGLRGFAGLPANEYEPEALSVVAEVCGCGNDRSLFWGMNENEALPALRAATAPEVRGILERVFAAAFLGAWADDLDWQVPSVELAQLLRRAGR